MKYSLKSVTVNIQKYFMCNGISILCGDAVVVASVTAPYLQVFKDYKQLFAYLQAEKDWYMNRHRLAEVHNSKCYSMDKIVKQQNQLYLWMELNFHRIVGEKFEEVYSTVRG